MTVRRGRWLVAGVAGGVVVFALGGFLVWAGLDDADRWSSVFGVFLNIAGLAVAVYSLVQARRTPSAEGAAVRNKIGHGRFDGAVVMARDVEQLSTTATPVPDTAPRSRPTGSGPQPGAVSNTIDDGQFHGPVIMGRDVRGVVLPPPDSDRPDPQGTAR